MSQMRGSYGHLFRSAVPVGVGRGPGQAPRRVCPHIGWYPGGILPLGPSQG
jgi:hypothetical protein